MTPTSDDEISGPAPSPSQDGPQDAAVLAAVVNSFYPELVQGGRLAKERAQQMLSAVTILSAALIAALVAGGTGDASSLTKIVAVIAVGAWVLASAFLAWAATPDRRPGYDTDLTAWDLVRRVIDDSDTMERVVEARLRWATLTTVVALLVSVASFAVYVFAQRGEEWEPASVTYTSQQAAPQCADLDLISTYVAVGTLEKEFVRIKVDCSDGSSTEWLIPRSSVLTIRTG